MKMRGPSSRPAPIRFVNTSFDATTTVSMFRIYIQTCLSFGERKRLPENVGSQRLHMAKRTASPYEQSGTFYEPRWAAVNLQPKESPLALPLWRNRIARISRGINVAGHVVKIVLRWLLRHHVITQTCVNRIATVLADHDAPLGVRIKYRLLFLKPAVLFCKSTFGLVEAVHVIHPVLV